MIETPQTINVKQITEIILKWHWIIIVPFCLAMITGSYLVIKLPRVFEAKTVILVQPQKVSSDIVSNVVASDINTRISTLSQRILSRTNLEKIIKDFQLYPGTGSQSIFIENKVGMLKKRIDVTVTQGRNRNADSFSISFKGKNPEKVMKITNSLASSFINENLKMRETQVMGTNVFLEDELTTMRKKLTDHEKALKDYRERYMGGLPEQLNSNLRILDNLNDQLTNTMSGISTAQGRLSALGQESEELFPTTNEPGNSRERPRSLEGLQSQLEMYLNRYTEKHPDVIRLKKQIANLEQQLKSNVDIDGELANDINHTSNIQGSVHNRQKELITVEIKRFEIEKRKILQQIQLYNKRIEDTPKREQELMSLQRDYSNINETYNSLLGRQLETQIAVNMEKKQKGEQFRILDPARLPQSPVSPDKKMLFIFVMVAGLGIGGCVIFIIEFLDSSFREPEELESFLDIPVIATVPTILLSKDLKWIKVKTACSIAGIIISIILLACFIGAMALTG